MGDVTTFTLYGIDFFCYKAILALSSAMESFMEDTIIVKSSQKISRSKPLDT